MAMLFIAAGGAMGFVGPDKEKPMIPIDDLLSEDVQMRNRAVDAILRERVALIERLIPLIDPANAQNYRDETRSVAAYLLGEFRAVEAVPVLAAALADPPGPRQITDSSRFDAPVFTALVKIGRPAIPAIISNIESSDDRRLRKGSLDVLNHVLGGKRRLLELLVKLADRTDDRDVSRRVREAHSWAEAHYKEDKEPLY